MTIHATRFGVAILLVSVVALVEPAHAEQASERASISAYEAEQFTTFSGAGRPEQTVQSKVYQAADGSVREESPQGVRITNARTRTIAVLLPELRQALVSSMPVGRRQAPGRRPAGVVPVQSMVDGRPTLKYENLNDPKVRSRTWVDVRSGAIVYSEFSSDTGTFTRVLRKVKVGPVPRSLFEVPKDYSQIPMELPDTPPQGPGGTPRPAGKPLGPVPQE